MKRMILWFLLVAAVSSAQVFSGINLGAGGTATSGTVDESDDFSSATLDPSWTWRRGVGGSYSIGSGSIVISGGSGSEVEPTGIFKVIEGASWTATIRFDGENKNHSGFHVGMGTDFQRFGRVSLNRVGTYDYTASYTPTTNIYLRMTREGPTLRYWYSVDGSSYSELVDVTTYAPQATDSEIIGLTVYSLGGAIGTATFYDFTVTK